MNKVSKTGLMLVAIVVVLNSFGLFYISLAYGQPIQAAKPFAKSVMPPPREMIDILLTIPASQKSPPFDASAIVSSKPGVIESIAAECNLVAKVGGMGLALGTPARLTLTTFQPNYATVRAQSGQAQLLSAQQFNYIITPLSFAKAGTSGAPILSHYDSVPVTRLEMPTGKEFNVILSNSSPGSNCRVHLVIRYSQ